MDSSRLSRSSLTEAPRFVSPFANCWSAGHPTDLFNVPILHHFSYGGYINSEPFVVHKFCGIDRIPQTHVVNVAADLIFWDRNLDFIQQGSEV